ncbi:MAG: hypothetical protein IRY85_11585 [Micromonosporaceae bacterium]|nr:hypothetical protein [Micromonosporaceae bacterium]
MRTAIRLLAAASAALLLSACSAAPNSVSSDPAMDTQAEPEPPAVVEPLEEDMEAARSNAAAWCALIPSSLVASTLGMQLESPTASFSAEEVNCTYLPVEDGGRTIQVQFRLSQDHESFIAVREESDIPGVEIADLPNVGDEAFYTSSEFGDVVTNTVTARQGSVVLTVGAPSPLEGVTELVRQVFDQLA